VTTPGKKAKRKGRGQPQNIQPRALLLQKLILV
jgi:hypothetical protein